MKYEIDQDGCWIWTGALTRGYGHLQVGGKHYRAHRYAWELYHGKIPDDLMVLHRCDKPACVNPDHLFLGNQDDNLRDARTKGRLITAGERNGSAKLTTEQVLEIRVSGESLAVLSRRYGVCKQAISKIKRRENWKHVCYVAQSH